MQTIIGAGGAIGRELAKNLTNYTDEIRLVSRNPKKVNENDQLVEADLTTVEGVEKGIKGSEVVYVTVGFEYKTKIWKQLWVPFIERVIDACAANNAKLVFFDNIYMYDPEYLDGMDEETPIRPVSEKGKIRAEVAKKVMAAHASGKVQAQIARAADFMGPTQNSIPYGLMFEKLSKGKAAQWLCRKDKVHNFTYTPDAGMAMALLGNTESAYGEVWHMPSDSSRFTMEELTTKMAEMLGAQSKLFVLPKFALTPLGWFIPPMKELIEMSYQYERDYLFDSSKIEKRFGIAPTPIREQILALMKSNE